MRATWFLFGVVFASAVWFVVLTTLGTGWINAVLGGG